VQLESSKCSWGRKMTVFLDTIGISVVIQQLTVLPSIKRSGIRSYML
jgi:hypothetical protein